MPCCSSNIERGHGAQRSNFFTNVSGFELILSLDVWVFISLNFMAILVVMIPFMVFISFFSLFHIAIQYVVHIG